MVKRFKQIITPEILIARYPDELELLYVIGTLMATSRRSRYTTLYKQLCEKYDYKIIPVIDGIPHSHRPFLTQDSCQRYIKSQLHKKRKEEWLEARRTAANLNTQLQQDTTSVTNTKQQN